MIFRTICKRSKMYHVCKCLSINAFTENRRLNIVAVFIALFDLMRKRRALSPKNVDIQISLLRCNFPQLISFFFIKNNFLRNASIKFGHNFCLQFR